MDKSRKWLTLLGQGGFAAEAKTKKHIVIWSMQKISKPHQKSTFSDPPLSTDGITDDRIRTQDYSSGLQLSNL